MTTLEDVQTYPSKRSTARWRLIEGRSLSGADNMALDEALLDSVLAGAPPVVRFYTWEPPALSLGVNQPLGEISPEECAKRGFSVVRRLTGGRAVLHQHELTYSVIAPSGDPRVSGGVVESYRKISEALIAGLGSLGADVSIAPQSRAARQAILSSRSGDAGESYGAVCFSAASAYELTAGGRKLVGSAQARRGAALLQHGSILLDVDYDAWASVFAYRTPAGRERALNRLPSRMTSLREQLGRPVASAEVSSALRTAFEQVFEVTFGMDSPSMDELSAAKRLAESKYESPVWTARK